MKNSNQKNSLIGLIFIAVLMLFGVVLLYFAFFTDEMSKEGEIDGFYKKTVSVIVALSFIGFSIYGLIMHLLNIVISPVNETLYLKSDKADVYCFIDKNEHKYYLEKSKENNYKVGNYYLVSKTVSYIKHVFGESNDKFEIKEDKVDDSTRNYVSSIFVIILGLLMAGLFGYTAIRFINSGLSILVIPFFVIGIAILIRGIGMLLVSFKRNINIEKSNMVANMILALVIPLFGFLFLILVSYLCVRDKNYIFLIFTIPFWLILVYYTFHELNKR